MHKVERLYEQSEMNDADEERAGVTKPAHVVIFGLSLVAVLLTIAIVVILVRSPERFRNIKLLNPDPAPAVDAND